MKAWRAFTLIEVLVATTMMLVVLAGAVAVFTFAVTVQAEGIIRNQLARDGQLVLDTLGRDLSFAGVGVPRGFRGDVADFTGGTRESHQLRPVFRRFKAAHLVLVGDLPYPNADLHGVVAVAHIDPATDAAVAVTSELSPCVPTSAVPGDYRCEPHLASSLGPFPAGDACTAANPTARTCPWAMHKWQRRNTAPVHLVFGGIDGRWFEREWNIPNTVGVGPYLALALEPTSPDGNTYTGTAPALPQSSFFASRGGGFVAQLDRVFWSLEEPGAPGTPCSSIAAPFCVLRRRQCWGAVVDPGAADFPVVGDGAYRADRTPTDCAPPFDGTDWETVVTGVRALGLRAFDATGVELVGAWTPAQAALVASVEMELVLEARVPGTARTLSQRLRQRVHIKNRGGIDGGALADGGCNDVIDRPGCLGEN